MILSDPVTLAVLGVALLLFATCDAILWAQTPGQEVGGTDD